MNNKANIRPFLRQFYRGNGGYLVLSFGKTVFYLAVNMLVSWLFQVVTDLAAGQETGFTLGQVCGLTGLSLVLTFLAFGASYISRPRFTARAMAQYKTYVFEQMSKKSISAFTGENTSRYISALSNDVAAIENGYLRNLFIIVDDCALFVGAFLLMLWYSPLLTLAAVALSAVPLLAALITGNWMGAEEKQVSDKKESYMSTLHDALAGFSVVKSFRAEKQMCRIFAEEVDAVADAQQRRQKMSILVDGFTSAAGLTLQMGVFLIGAWLAISGISLSAGTVVVFAQLVNYIIFPVGSVPKALAEMKASKALISKLAEALEANVRREGGEEKGELASAITLDRLSYAYEPGKPVLQELSFRFEKGKRYCVVGASGSGKSTLLNLLMGAHLDYQGSICYDDTPLQAISSQALFEMVSVVQQNVFIFNASIRDNITMFSRFPKVEVDRAIQLSGLSRLVEEKGEDYLCGENGSGLSGGEKQRISIARSLLKNAQVLLVDEATAALDTQTAAQVIHAILDLEDITSIVVTHAMEAGQLKRYDGILALKNGRLAEWGTFEALMEEKGYFYSLYTVSQS